jgi:excisionase family DNA binding protein
MQTQLAYSIADACRACGIGRTTLYAAIKRGEIVTTKIGRRRVVLSVALNEWLASLAAPPRAAIGAGRTIAGGIKPSTSRKPSCDM